MLEGIIAKAWNDLVNRAPNLRKRLRIVPPRRLDYRRCNYTFWWTNDLGEPKPPRPLA
jgi:hypothetical protein